MHASEWTRACSIRLTTRQFCSSTTSVRSVCQSVRECSLSFECFVLLCMCSVLLCAPCCCQCCVAMCAVCSVLCRCCVDALSVMCQCRVDNLSARSESCSQVATGLTPSQLSPLHSRCCPYAAALTLLRLPCHSKDSLSLGLNINFSND
jgi:hypothetical protein